MATVDFKEANCSYPDKGHEPVRRLTLAVADGEAMVLLGPSGSGKATVLRMLAGLQSPDSGSVFIGGKDVTRMPPGKRQVSMVFQRYSAYRDRVVGDVAAFEPTAAGVPETAAERRVRQIAAELDIADHLDARPGPGVGQGQRRLSIGRPTVRGSLVHLLDEPLNVLDMGMRSPARARLAALQRRTGITTLYTTDDHVEAAALGDRVAVLNEGVLQQVDTPRGLYERPANTFVAGFVGTPPMNLVPGQHSNGWIFMGSANVLEIPIAPALAAGLTTRSVIVGFRPEHARFVPLGSGIYAVVETIEDLGHAAHVQCDIGAGREHQPLVVRCDPHDAPKPGSVVAVMPELDKLHLFDRATGDRL